MNENEKAESCSLLKHIWASMKKGRDMTSEHRFYTTQAEECGIWSPNEFLKLANTQDILVRRDFTHPDIKEVCSFKNNKIHSSLTLQTNSSLRRLN